MTVIGSFSSVPSPVDREHDRITVSNLFGESRQTFMQRWRAAALETRSYHLIFPYSRGTSGRNLAVLYRPPLLARFRMRTQELGGWRNGKCVVSYGGLFCWKTTMRSSPGAVYAELNLVSGLALRLHSRAPVLEVKALVQKCRH